MKKELEQLKEFHTKFNSTWQDAPALIDDKTRELRVRLMREELEEVIEAMKENNIEHLAKEMADLLYAVYGTIGSYGLTEKMSAVFDEVHRSHMSKSISEGSDYKATKGENFIEADINSILQK